MSRFDGTKIVKSRVSSLYIAIILRIVKHCVRAKLENMYHILCGLLGRILSCWIIIVYIASLAATSDFSVFLQVLMLVIVTFNPSNC